MKSYFQSHLLIPVKVLVIIPLLLQLLVVQVFAVDQKDMQVALTIAGEALGEGYNGMYAVACVIQNRAKRSHLSPIEIVGEGFYGKSTKVALQGYKTEKKWLLSIVYLLNNLELLDITNGALYFESTDFPRNISRFDKLYKRCYQYRKHIFYKDRDK